MKNPVEVKAEGVSDDAVILIAKELAQCAGIVDEDISAMSDRESALTILGYIATVARLNPMLDVVSALGCVPPETDLSITVDLIEAQS